MYTGKRRKSNRKSGYDYSRNGYYFVTICVKNRIECLGEVRKEEMRLNKYGNYVVERWLWLAEQYDFVELDEYIVMPNHVHGIIAINSDLIELKQKNTVAGDGLAEICTMSVGTGRDLSLRNIKIKSLSELMGAFKTTSSKLIHDNRSPEFAWQRSFYDHIIRNMKELQKIRKYIYYNPAKWESDRNNPENLLM